MERAIVKADQPSQAISRIECPERFETARYVKPVIDPRVGGLTIDVNFSPDGLCNYDCLYCTADRKFLSNNSPTNVDQMVRELTQLLSEIFSENHQNWPCYRTLPRELLKLRQVTISGTGEPTLSPCFVEGVESIVQLRSQAKLPFFKLVLSTNGSQLNRFEIKPGIDSFSTKDDIWVKLDTGTQRYMNLVNQTDCTLKEITSNILRLASKRPVVIQSLFAIIDGILPSAFEIESYIQELETLVKNGAKIPLVQIYSTSESTPNSRHQHLNLKQLREIAQRVNEITGLKVEVF